MLNSLKNLFSNQYNKKHPIAALSRFAYWKFIRLFKLKNVCTTIWGDRKILLNSNSFHSMWLMYNYIVDREEFNLIKDFVNPDDVVADIGTNIGYYTIWFSKFTNNIHSFEPDAKNFGTLRANIKLNNLQKVKANNIALADHNGELLFTTSLDGENHIDTAGAAGSVKVKACTLDSYAAENHIGHFRYVKVDVEGFEIKVLKGAETLLSNQKVDILQLELNATVTNSGTQISDTIDLLKRHAYTLCRYDVDNRELIEVSYVKERENYFAVADLPAVNTRLKQTL